MSGRRSDAVARRRRREAKAAARHRQREVKPAARPVQSQATPSVIAWRAWASFGDGYLRAPFFRVPTEVPPWQRGVHRAVCNPGLFSGDRGSFPPCAAAPGEGCLCGVYGVRDLRELMAFHTPKGSTWSDAGHVIGQVELSGTILEANTWFDPPSTLRASRGRVTGSVYFPRPSWPEVKRFKALHPWVTVHRVESLSEVPAAAASLPGVDPAATYVAADEPVAGGGPDRVWRVWRIGVGEDPAHRPGMLYAPLIEQPLPWTGGQHTAFCGAPPGIRQGTAHEPPGEHCCCGVAGVTDPRELFGEPWASRGYWQEHGTTWVIGRAELTGPVRPGVAIDDSPSTVRAARGRVADVIYLPRSTWHVADDFRRLHPGVRVELVDTPEDALPLIDRVDRQEAAA